MIRLFTTALFAMMLQTTPGVEASESAAETCLRTKVWDGYADNWGIRTMTSTELEAGKTKNYLVTLYKGNEYRITTCADKSVTNLDVLLYNTEGEVIAKDSTVDREPQLEFKPTETATYYIVLYMRELDGKKTAADAAMAVVYR